MQTCASLLLLAILPFSPAAVAADSLTCPANINTHQQLAASLPGWSTFLDDTPHLLAGITFYDGPPQEKASLAYDSISKSAGMQSAKWTFAPAAGRATWIACSYADTSVRLTRPLPTNTATCEVTYDAHQQIDGLPAIRKIACR